MVKRKRKTTVFSLAFLDIMSCGFGAVVLLFMIINHTTKESSDETNHAIISEVNLMDKRVELAERNLFELKNTVEDVEKKQQDTTGQVQQVVQVLEEKRLELASLDESTLASKEAIEKLKADLKSLDESTQRLQGSQQQSQDTGDDLRRITGAGDRLYLTGLKMGGERVLFLVDSSASMLGETIVNIIRRRNMSNNAKRNAPKWRRAVGSVEWLIAKLPKDIKFQVYTFNRSADPALASSAGKWLSTSNPEDVSQTIGALQQVVPANGTSLHQAFQIARQMSPAPDNIYLITDGLPTMGEKPGVFKTASPKAREAHFKRAINALTPGIPVNIILFPMEGDPRSTPNFWRLAQITNGSLISPARDWP